MQDIYYAALLSDVAQICLPVELIDKPYLELSSTERTTVQKLPLMAGSILMPLDYLEQAVKIIRHHREFQDGSGYPDGLAGENIPVGSKILLVVSDYYKLIEGRVVKEKLETEEAFRFLRIHSNSWYDKNIVEKCIEVIPVLHRPAAGDQLKLTSKDLKVNMTLAKHFLGPNGMILLACNHCLNAKNLEKIQQLEKEWNKKFVFHVFAS